MRAVVQRVSRAQVNVGNEVVGKIGPGLVVLLGISKSDAEADAEYLAAKITGLRIFDDNEGQMNLSLAHVAAQFSPSRNLRCTAMSAEERGRRSTTPPPRTLRPNYEYFVRRIRASGLI